MSLACHCCDLILESLLSNPARPVRGMNLDDSGVLLREHTLIKLIVRGVGRLLLIPPYGVGGAPC